MLRVQRNGLCWLRHGLRVPSPVTKIQNRWIRLSSVPNLSDSHPEVKELEIPMPWGKIAARHWNYKSGTKPILCVHGWKDNAASFDTLLPLLAKETPQYQFLAIDLPGHGRSSHFPPGMLYLLPDIFLLYRRIFRHFGWDKISIMAHSMGAHFSFMFAGTYPDLVEKFVAIDSLTPFVQNRKDSLEIAHKITHDMLKFEDKIQSGVNPTFTYDELLDKLLKTNVGQMPSEACKTLLTRGMEEHPPGSGRYKFSHDTRVHYLGFQGISSRQVAFLMQNLRSDILLIKAEDGLMYTVNYIEQNKEKWLAYDINGNHKGNIIAFASVPGNHHVHLIEPESVLPHIAGFLSQSRAVESRKQKETVSL